MEELFNDLGLNAAERELVRYCQKNRQTRELLQQWHRELLQKCKRGLELYGETGVQLRFSLPEFQQDLLRLLPQCYGGRLTVTAIHAVPKATLALLKSGEEELRGALAAAFGGVTLDIDEDGGMLLIFAGKY